MPSAVDIRGSIAQRRDLEPRFLILKKVQPAPRFLATAPKRSFASTVGAPIHGETKDARGEAVDQRGFVTFTGTRGSKLVYFCASARKDTGEKQVAAQDAHVSRANTRPQTPRACIGCARPRRRL